MTSVLLAFFIVCVFHVHSAGIVENGLTTGKYMSHKRINTTIQIITLNYPPFYPDKKPVLSQVSHSVRARHDIPQYWGTHCHLIHSPSFYHVILDTPQSIYPNKESSFRECVQGMASCMCP